MLVDTGPLVALLDVNDDYHSMCRIAAASMPVAPFVTTWPCFTEAMYFLGTAGGWRLQNNLWKLHRIGKLLISEISTFENTMMETLMDKYKNVPMDLADASLMAIADNRRYRELFTIDSDFYIYRKRDGNVLSLVPNVV